VFFRDTSDTETPRDRPFEDFRYPVSPKARAVVFDVIGQLQRYEQEFRLRRRRRKAEDQKTFETTVATVVCDLIHRWVTEPEGWVAVSLSNDTLGRADRYKSPALNKTLPIILERLSSPEMAFVEMRKGLQGKFVNGYQTTIQAGARLVNRIDDQGLTLADVAVERHQEVIVLKSARANVFTNGDLVDYEDDDRTRLYRDQMNRINDWLSGADILLDPYIGSLKGVDGSDRFLKRIFNNSSFEAGGRLFGGFWQPLDKRERLQGIRIKGSPVICLDYGQMAPRILYGMAGVNPPEEDLYYVPIYLGHREGIKKVFNAMLFVDKPFDRFPAGTRKLFHRSEKIHRVVSEIMKQHQPISQFFFTRVGFKTMFIESQIMVDVLLTFMEKGIVGLPIHDGIVVAQDDKETAIVTMLNAFRRHTGIDGRVTIEDKCES